MAITTTEGLRAAYPALCEWLEKEARGETAVMKTILIFTIFFLSFSVPLWAVDLQNASLKELVNQRPDLIADIKSGKNEGTVTISVIKDAKGRMSIWTEEKKNLDKVTTGKRVDKYTYYSNSVNEIIQERYEGAELTLVSKQKVKHYLDGTQPDVIPMNIEIPKEEHKK